ncbi:MAG: hypothetical protein DRJ57_03845 [Thermoprotei archaeon]|nr:MAG: hypothetical protein DRJ57_03845 [Thermoprotei archaeon]
MRPFLLHVKPVNVEEWLVRRLSEGLGRTFSLKIVISRDLSLSHMLEFYDEEREQVRADLLLDALSSKSPPLCLVLVDADAYVAGLNFVFGVARAGWGGIVFLTRLRQEFYGLPPNEELLAIRTLKEALHELGHALGLGHCRTPRCVMRFSNSILDVDSKTPYFCLRCRRELELLHPGLLKF